MTNFEQFLASYAETFNISRKAFAVLREGLGLINSLDELTDLPRGIGTLKRRMVAQLPLIPLRHKIIQLNQNKLPTMVPAEKAKAGHQRQADAHWFELSSLIARILSSKDIWGGMWHGLGWFVNTPTELWHSDSWLCSARTSSGEHACYSNGTPIVWSDFVEYRSRGAGDGVYVGRVYSVGRDHQSHTIEKNAVAIKIQRACFRGNLPDDIQDKGAALDPLILELEMLLAEDNFEFVLEDDILNRIDMTITYNFESGIPGSQNAAFDPKSQIRQIFNEKRGDIRPAIQSHPHIAELEIRAHGRQWLTELLQRGFISAPLIMFIDVFGLYRNMYRSLTGVYFSLAGQTLRARMHRANVFVLTLGPHGASSDEVLSFIVDLPKLDRGMVLTINARRRLYWPSHSSSLGICPSRTTILESRTRMPARDVETV
ncbi:hypothetical protein GMDG_04632 [Pseudogymnoascus destructans 20631-21]|uniref:Uncharacterized protein n=1 Tax=Pseudogymnoascus destructans (strain ATCC MYA-4855 / 20631-21) TaxID=658429 RepID=L8GBJ9_PSED2|nr:hypothetical protein GMDG_04632 [Pseudogymnoascus destructans 20631-21]